MANRLTGGQMQAMQLLERARCGMMLVWQHNLEALLPDPSPQGTAPL